EKLPEPVVEAGGRRLHRGALKAIWSRVSIGIEHRLLDAVASRPEAGRRHLVAVRLAGDRVRQVRDASWVERSPPAGEARHGQGQRSQEEMHGAHLADE